MGMFDKVNFKMLCPTCGYEGNEFQTKDLGCHLDVVEPDALGNFYALCHKCKSWIEFSRPFPDHAPREIPLTLAEVLDLGFDLTVDLDITKRLAGEKK